jgi:hypothetical protein
MAARTSDHAEFSVLPCYSLSGNGRRTIPDCIGVRADSIIKFTERLGVAVASLPAVNEKQNQNITSRPDDRGLG